MLGRVDERGKNLYQHQLGKNLLNEVVQQIMPVSTEPIRCVFQGKQDFSNPRRLGLKAWTKNFAKPARPTFRLAEFLITSLKDWICDRAKKRQIWNFSLS